MNSIAKIMIIGEDEALLTIKQLHLLKEGFEVIELDSIYKIENNLPNINLIIINSGYQGMDGLDILEYIRQKDFSIPIIFLGNNDSQQEIEKAFSIGADDYLSKPFGIVELVCRIKAILKRSYGIKKERLTHRDITLDLNQRVCYVNEEEVDLTKLEFDLLNFFIEHKNRILEREYILSEVWGDEAETKKRTVNVRMNRLIKKIDPNNTKAYFTAIRGIGYRFD
jgi:DNA-binding response OmpR family regulator